MSAFGPKQTSVVAPHMSASGAKRTSPIARQESTFDSPRPNASNNISIR